MLTMNTLLAVVAILASIAVVGLAALAFVVVPQAEAATPIEIITPGCSFNPGYMLGHEPDHKCPELPN